MLFRETSRRQALHKLAAGGLAAVGAAVDPLGLWRRTATAVGPATEAAGVEVYQGLALLAPQAVRPQPTRMPALAPPILEKIGEGPNPTGHMRAVSEAEARALAVPMWKVKGWSVSAIEATFSGSRVFDVTTVTKPRHGPFAVVCITCQPDYVRPYPVPAGGTPERPVLPTKTNGTPSPGIYWRGPFEVVAVWATDEGLHRLIATAHDDVSLQPGFPIEVEPL